MLLANTISSGYILHKNSASAQAFYRLIIYHCRFSWIKKIRERTQPVFPGTQAQYTLHQRTALHSGGVHSDSSVLGEFLDPIMALSRPECQTTWDHPYPALKRTARSPRIVWEWLGSLHREKRMYCGLIHGSLASAFCPPLCAISPSRSSPFWRNLWRKNQALVKMIGLVHKQNKMKSELAWCMPNMISDPPTKFPSINNCRNVGPVVEFFCFSLWARDVPESLYHGEGHLQ